MCVCVGGLGVRAPAAPIGKSCFVLVFALCVFRAVSWDPAQTPQCSGAIWRDPGAGELRKMN